MHQFTSVTQLCPTLCNPMDCRKLGFPVLHYLPEFAQTHVHWVSDAIQPSHPLSSPFLPAPNPSQHQSFPTSQLFTSGGPSTGVSALASVLPKKSQGWSPSEWTGWITLQSKRTLKSPLQHHSSKASILRRSVFFTVQLSHPYMTTGKTIALTSRTFVGKVMSLLYPSEYLIFSEREWGFPGGSVVKNQPAKAGDMGLTAKSGEDLLEEEMANHSSILTWRIPMDRGAWRATVHWVTKNWTWLSN